MYPSSVHGCTNGNAAWAGAAPLVSKILADADYDTGLVGKLHLAGAHARIEPRGDDGYRVFEWSHQPQNEWPEGHAYADWLGCR
jgi:arylsulfatase A-like enzyme